MPPGQELWSVREAGPSQEGICAQSPPRGVGSPCFWGRCSKQVGGTPSCGHPHPHPRHLLWAGGGQSHPHPRHLLWAGVGSPDRSQSLPVHYVTSHASSRPPGSRKGLPAGCWGCGVAETVGGWSAEGLEGRDGWKVGSREAPAASWGAVGGGGCWWQLIEVKRCSFCPCSTHMAEPSLGLARVTATLCSQQPVLLVLLYGGRRALGPGGILCPVGWEERGPSSEGPAPHLSGEGVQAREGCCERDPSQRWSLEEELCRGRRALGSKGAGRAAGGERAGGQQARGRCISLDPASRPGSSSGNLSSHLVHSADVQPPCHHPPSASTADTSAPPTPC